MKKVNAVSMLNLARDRKVLGANWLKTYNSYFGNEENICLFVKKILNYIPNKKELKILYPASAAGLLGESLVKKLEEKRIRSELFLVDISKKHLKENKNPKTKKIQADITKLKLGKKFDVVIMRSSLDYFPTKKLQIQVLSNLKDHLTEGGVFFNQAASMPSTAERDLADRIYKSSKKIGKRHFQCKKDIENLYEKAGFKKIKKIGEGPSLILTEKEHAERYDINKAQIKKIQQIIAKISAKKRPNIKITKTGYQLKFVFPIYAAW